MPLQEMYVIYRLCNNKVIVKLLHICLRGWGCGMGTGWGVVKGDRVGGSKGKREEGKRVPSSDSEVIQTKCNCVS